MTDPTTGPDNGAAFPGGRYERDSYQGNGGYAAAPASGGLPTRPAGQPGRAGQLVQASEPVHDDLAISAAIVLVLALLGAVLGPVWALWSPPGPRALVLSPGVFIPDETEAFVAADGRYVVIVAVVGLLAGFGAWRLRRMRGPLVLLGLAVGGIAGSLLMELTGHLTGGGSFTGRAIPHSSERFISVMPLSLHAHGLVFVEPGLAVLVYGLFVAFTAHDDLGRPDPVRERSARQPVSVDAGHQPQYGGGYGDASGPLQQRDLPAEQPAQPD